jgi:hypothetical protein
VHVKKQVRWAAMALLSLATLWSIYRHRIYSPENQLARALHGIREQDGWGRRLHQEIWRHLPQIVDEYAPGLSPIPLQDVHRAAAEELCDLAPQSKEAVQVLIEVMLEDPALEVVRTAIMALRNIGPLASAAIDPLLTLDNTPAMPWRSTVFDALCAIAPGNSIRLSLSRFSLSWKSMQRTTHRRSGPRPSSCMTPERICGKAWPW